MLEPSPTMRRIDHPIYGEIITSKYEIIRFLQDYMNIGYNAALVMYMYSTRSKGTYTEY